MPPHCDSMDGPVVQAAIRALEAEDVGLILPYVHKEGEREVAEVFQKVLKVRKNGDLTRELADRYFFETAVRVHRAGEGAPFTGLKPAGLDVGPVIPVAESAIEAGSAEPLSNLLCEMVRTQVENRYQQMLHLKEHAGEGMDQARAYVEAMLGLQVWSHSLYESIHSEPHAGKHEHG